MRIRVRISLVAMFGLLACVHAGIAMAQSCEAYFPFDGSLADASGNGFDGNMIGQDGTAAEPRFVEGRSGQALALDGTVAMRAFIDLHYDSCPQVSFTAWIRFDSPVPRDTRVILATGGSGPGLRSAGATLTLNGTANGLSARDAVSGDSGWMFVAGIYDYANSTYALHWRNRSVEGTLSEHRRPPEDAIWVGAMNDRLAHAASGIAIDDLRISETALGQEELRALARSRPAASATMPRPRVGPSLPGDQYDAAQLPGDQYDPARLPGDQYDPARLPGDQYDPARLPGDQYDPARLPGDQYDAAQLPGDQYDPARLPGDQLDRASESGQRPILSPAFSQSPQERLDESQPIDLGTESEAATGSRQIVTANVRETIQERVAESRPIKLGYDSEEEGVAAAEAGAQRRAQEEAEAEEEAEGDTPRNFIWVQFPTDIIVFSGVSGAAGDYTEQSVATGLPQRLPYWIETRENYDKPCTVYVHTRAIQLGFGEPEPFTKEYDVCDEGLPRINPLTTLYRAIHEPSAGEFGLVTGIQVCSNGINRRVKGIRARVRGLNLRTGAYSADYSTQVFEERTNCVSWDEMAHCPSNTYAVGLRLHFRDGDVVSPRDFLSGLELVCAEALVRRSGQAP